MSKNFYLGLIPIGEHCNWRKVLDSIAMTTVLHDEAYKCYRYFDSLEAKKYMDDEPVFFPNEAINLENDIKFRVAISAPLYFSDNSKNDISVITPWHDENIPYKNASWFGVDKIIKDHSDYILIIRQDYSRLGEHYNESNDYIKKVTDICDKYNKVYKIINHNDHLRYDDVYKYFLE